MPILDPSVQMKLIELFFTVSQCNTNYHRDFFMIHLNFAAKNKNRNIQTIESSISFKKNLKENLDLVNETFKCNFSQDIFTLPIRNYFKFLYDNSKPQAKDEKYFVGQNFCIDSYFPMKLFRPDINYIDKRSWFLGNFPYAILCLSNTFSEDICPLIHLEIDLIMSCGYTIILCAYFQQENGDFNSILNILFSHKFTEIHLSFNSKLDGILTEILNKINNNYDHIYGYLYFYSLFIANTNSQLADVIDKLKQKPRFQFFSISKNLREAFKASIRTIDNNFSLDVLNKEKIEIRLFTVPLYDSEDDINDFSPPINVSVCQAFISPRDFSYMSQKRVKILYNDKENNCCTYKFIDFNDIHKIKLDLLVEKSIYLVDTNEEMLAEVENFKKIYQKKSTKKDDFHQEKFSTLLTRNKISKLLAYISYSFEYCYKFSLHDNQIFTALEAIKLCLQGFKESKFKGVVYQVETGEGKSSIIILIAAVLVLMKKTVHITSSNINLSNRDYCESYYFFQKIGLTSAVLLHYNELPYINMENSKNNDTTVYDDKYYPKIFFDEQLFNNPSNMNFSVCGIDNKNNMIDNRAKIVFSTLINFECLYLKMMECYPSLISSYFGNCSLLIDEADSILIDELTNGTILSRSMKTNGKEILKFVYQSRIQKRKAEDVFEEIKLKWPKCQDMTIDDIYDMYQEIDMVQQDEFSDGKKYSIETYTEEDKNNNNLGDLIQNAKRKIINQFKKIVKGDKNVQEDEKVINKEINNKIFKKIVPFDYDNKGILEPNKEFSGFVQQFIAIKEIFNNKDNENMVIKDSSMNYLYVSHPIFVNLYDNVCGITGTIGNDNDKKILLEQYKLTTKIIPRTNPNYRIELPIVLCNNIQERNKKIVSEIIKFQKYNYPVLVIFQDLKEINDVFYQLIQKGVNNINIFNGKTDDIKPDQIAGVKRSVSLGTNVCGRGTDIRNPFKPLHVIVTYFSSNERAIYQAFGRTARQGQKGSVRIICLFNQFISPIDILNEKEMNDILKDYEFKNKLQSKFIDKIKNKREWIFSADISSQKLSQKDIETLRSAKININRIKAYEYEFPLCMSLSTFMNIQAQKIFSLYNCPNCKYTWMLFQKYAREMILESWSLFLNQTEKKYYQLKIKDSFRNFLKSESKLLFTLLNIYFPDSDKLTDYEIVPTFMHIFNLVLKRYENLVLSSFPDELSSFMKQSDNKKFASFSIGFKPFTLLDESGSRINTIDGSNQDQNYIKDPELKYMRKDTNNIFSILSITEKIDDIFNWICLKINNVIGSYIGLRFFLRRTLAGCEFGVCYDFDIENNDNKLLVDKNCLVDIDPLLVFTISVKSMIPILAGILIIGLVYIASISESITEWITAFPVKITTKLIKMTLKEVSSLIISSQIDLLCDKLCSFLLNILKKQIEKINKIKPKKAKIFYLLMKIAATKNFSNFGDSMFQLFEEKSHFHINMDFYESFMKEKLPIASFLKIGFLLLLCFASFMMNFYLHRKSIGHDSEKDSFKYEQIPKTIENTLNIEDKNITDKETIEKISFDLEVKKIYDE